MSTSVVLFNGLGSNDEPGLWVTDGTAAGTSELSVELSTGLNPQFITNFNGKALFAGADPNSTGAGLWVTNGTAAGTSEIGGPGSTGISDANFDGLQPGSFQVYKGEALFRGAAGLAGGEVFGLWVTDGTAAGTSEIGGNENAGIKNADTGGLLKDPPDFTPFNGKVLFRGWDKKGEVGLWVTNGTATGTSELAPIAGAAFGPTAPPTGFDIQPQYMAVLGNKVLFDGADQEDTAGSLWVTNGTVAGTTEVGGQGNKGIKNVPFSDPAGDLPDGLQPYDLTTFGSEVLFAGQDDTLFHGSSYNHTFALWESNGTAAGTTEIGGFGNSEIAEANSAANRGIFNSIGNPDFTVFGSEVLFIGRDSADHIGLWVTNGTASGTTEVGGLNGAGLSEVLNFSNTVNPDFTVYGSEVLFDGLDSSNNATLWKTDGTAAGTSEISSQAIAPEDMTLFTSGAQLAVTSVLQNPTSGSGADLKAGGTVLITLVMTEDAIVSGTPKLELNVSGGSASYVSGSGTPDLTFKYTVASGQNIPDLEVTSTSLVGATITNAGGFSADLSRVSGTDLGIKIDTTAPTVNSVSATPASGTTLKLGGTAKIDLDLSEAVIVSGSPTLKLSDGGTAVYNPAASTPATGVLEFDYTVTSHQSSSDLTIVSASLAGGASITDSAGNAANLALTAAEKNLNLGVNGIPPIVTAVTAVASPPGTDVINGGTVAITLKLSEAVTVSGTPILELSDGGSAHYVSSVTASSLVFDYNVGSKSTTDLRITGVSGAIVDAAGNDLSSSLSSDLKLQVNVFTFTHTTSGGIWNSSTNWTPQEVPGAGNTALITKTGTYTVSSTENNSVAVIDTAAGATLVVGGGTVFDVTAGTGAGANAGKIKLADGGTLELGGTFVNNGSITLSGTTSVTALELDGATISGGKLQTSGPSALIKTVAGSNVLHGATIVSGSYVAVASGTQLTFSGGTIGSAATVSATSGSTAIMSGLVTDAGTLALNGVTSVGTSATLETLAGGTAILSGAVTNSGTLFASGAHSLIEIASGAMVTGGGIAKIANGVFDIAGAGDNQSVVFLAGGTGVLDIADAHGNTSAFGGTVSGFGQNVHQFIDLTRVGFVSGVVSASYSSSTASSGVLTVTSGGSANVVAAIDLMGHYVTSNFHIIAGPGGTVEIFDPPITKTPTDSFGPENLVLFVNYLAAAFPGTGPYGSGLISDLSQAGSEPLLTHPRG